MGGGGGLRLLSFPKPPGNQGPSIIQHQAAGNGGVGGGKGEEGKDGGGRAGALVPLEREGQGGWLEMGGSQIQSGCRGQSASLGPSSSRYQQDLRATHPPSKTPPKSGIQQGILPLGNPGKSVVPAPTGTTPSKSRAHCPSQGPRPPTPAQTGLQYHIIPEVPAPFGYIPAFHQPLRVPGI